MAKRTAIPVVALFSANRDTVEMVQGMLAGWGVRCLVGCHFADRRKGEVDFAHYIATHNPDVVMFDIVPPYWENWDFFMTLRAGPAMDGRGLVLTTTSRRRLDEAVGGDSFAYEIVGKPYDLKQIKHAILAALRRVAAARSDIPLS